MTDYCGYCMCRNGRHLMTCPGGSVVALVPDVTASASNPGGAGVGTLDRVATPYDARTGQFEELGLAPSATPTPAMGEAADLDAPPGIAFQAEGVEVFRIIPDGGFTLTGGHGYAEVADMVGAAAVKAEGRERQAYAVAIAALVRGIGEAKERLAARVVELADLRRTVEALTADFAGQRSRAERAESDLTTARDEVRDLTADRDSWRRVSETLEREKTRAREDCRLYLRRLGSLTSLCESHPTATASTMLAEWRRRFRVEEAAFAGQGDVLSDADLTRLSRVFNLTPHGGYGTYTGEAWARINPWLGRRIAEAREREATSPSEPGSAVGGGERSKGGLDGNVRRGSL